MITYIYGSLFESPAQVLVNAVNTVGVMGKGVALQFKKNYPNMFIEYQRLCEKKQFKVGQLWLYKTPNKWILNFPTKEDWRSKSKLEYIEIGLRNFADTYMEKGITSIAFPQLGCGNGELDWETEVRLLMEQYLSPLPISVYIYLYNQEHLIPEHKNTIHIEKWLHQEVEVLPFEEFWIDLKKMISEKQSFIDSNGSIFSVYTENKNLIINLKKPITIGEEDLLELWQLTRTIGYVFPQNLPHSVENCQDYIISLLKNLPYLQLIKLIGTNDAIIDGLQLISTNIDQIKSPRQIEMFPELV